ncbi:MAG: glycosyltransferase family A protein, partial [Synechococcales bacterium]|nr:glycosyltransferase family A protein [Synechococcales bacterium]
MSISVSVIIPAYNAEPFIAETLDSVLQQTMTAFEVIVVNDGSTDQTAAIVERYMQKDDRITLITQENRGLSPTRQRGKAASKGEFLAFLDADDIWMPTHLEAHLQHFAANPQLGISFGRVEFIQADSTPTGALSNLRLRQIQPQHLYYENLLVTPSNTVMRRIAFEQVGGFDPELSGTADQELFLRTRWMGWDVEGLDQVLIRYRVTANAMSSQFNKMEQDWLNLNRKVKSYAPELVQKYEPRSKAYFLRYVARRSLRIQTSRGIGIQFINRAL